MTSFGIFYFPTDRVMQGVYEPEDVTEGPHAMGAAELARAVEARGFESLFFPEHTHIPTPRRTEWVGGPQLPAEYWHTLDPFVALGAAAAVTERIRLGTGIAIVPQRDPFSLAKHAASLDWLSGGRAILGIGSGWNAEEMADHGVDFKERWKVTREHILAVRRIWEDKKAEYHGDYVDFDPLLSYPKPLQPGGIPVLMGAQTRYAMRRVVEYCDGWMPIFLAGVLEPRDMVAQLKHEAEKAGRDFSTLDMSCYAFNPFGGAPPEAFIASLIEHGFTRIVFRVPSVGDSQAQAVLDEYAAVAERFS